MHREEKKISQKTAHNGFFSLVEEKKMQNTALSRARQQYKMNKPNEENERELEKYVKLSMTYLLCIHLAQWSRSNEQLSVQLVKCCALSTNFSLSTFLAKCCWLVRLFFSSALNNFIFLKFFPFSSTCRWDAPSHQ